MPLRHVVRSEHGPREESEIYDYWLVVTQDCDLAWRALVNGSADFLVELRPVFFGDPPSELGIRGYRLLLGRDGAYVDNRMPRLMVSPEVIDHSTHLTCPTPSNARQIKTWLGLRYDRPAYPQRYVKLAGALATEVGKGRNKVPAAMVRDILVTFETEDDQDFFELVAVLPHEGQIDAEKKQEIEGWLAQVSQTISEDLGVAQSLSVLTANEVTLHALENSYALDTANVTWPRSRLGPIGAE